MRYVLVGLLLLAGLAPLAFAQSYDCEQTCCEAYGGTWDEDYQWCSGADSGYNDCSSSCYEATSDGSYSGSSSFSCCGSAFVLASVGAGAFFFRR
jgi:hypothetical protein